jgi:hypothetical protein
MAETRIHLTFSTTAGDLEHEFPVNQPLHALKREVMGRLKLDSSNANDFVVVFAGNLLDDHKTLRELSVPEDAILVIERRELVKI